jgi:acyl carrier protein
MLETYFRTQLARLLRLEPAAVDLDQPVSTMGLDSLTTVELKTALERSLGVNLPVSSFLQGASISQLVSQVLHDLATPTSAIHPRDVSELLHEIRQLSDDQVKRLLGTDRVSAGGTL